MPHWSLYLNVTYILFNFTLAIHSFHKLGSGLLPTLIISEREPEGDSVEMVARGRQTEGQIKNNEAA